MTTTSTYRSDPLLLLSLSNYTHSSSDFARVCLVTTVLAHAILWLLRRGTVLSFLPLSSPFIQLYTRMPPSSTLSTCLFARIDQWAQEVVTHTEQHNQRRTGSSGHGMRLRSLPARQGLTEISINPHSRKRKATAAMEDINKTGAGKRPKIGSRPPKH